MNYKVGEILTESPHDNVMHYRALKIRGVFINYIVTNNLFYIIYEDSKFYKYAPVRKIIGNIEVAKKVAFFYGLDR